MPHAAHFPSVVPPFVQRIFGFTTPTRFDAKRFVQERNRESAQRSASKEAEHQALLAEIERQGEIARSFIPARSASRTFATSSSSRSRGGARSPMARPQPTATFKPRPVATPQARSGARTKTIDPAAVYAAVNAKNDGCGECGGHVAQPLHGFKALNVKPTPPKARSLSEIAASVYGFGGGEGPGLIATSARGGSR